MRLKDFLVEGDAGGKLATLKAAMKELGIKTKLPTATGYVNEERLEQAIQAWNIGATKGMRWDFIGTFMMGLSTSKELSTAHTALSKARNTLRRAEEAIPGGLLPSQEMVKLDAAIVHTISSLQELPELMKALTAFMDVFTHLLNSTDDGDEFKAAIARGVMGNLGLKKPSKPKP